MREDGIRDLPLDGEGLAAAGLSANEAHRARKESSVADDEVSRLLGLAVVTAAGLVQLLACERHLHGDLAGRQVPEDVDVVVAQGKNRVERLALPQVERLHAQRVALGDAHDLLDLPVELLQGRRIGVDEARVAEEPLVLVPEEVEELLGLLLRVAELRGQDGVVVALPHRGSLLVDDLLVHPVELALHQGERIGLSQGPGMDVDGQRDREVDDVCDVVVFEHRSEALDEQDLAIDVVHPECVRPALGLEVDEHGRDEVLGAQARLVGQFVPVEGELAFRPELRLKCAQALGAVEGVRLAPDSREGLDAVALDARELWDCAVDVGGADHVGQVPVALEVGEALPHLVVEDAVVLLDVLGGRFVALFEERPLADLPVGNGHVCDGELEAGVRAEVVVQAR